MTQEEVAVRMWTTKSVVSRLESGVCTRPTLTTIEKYAVRGGSGK
jgi:transcriptional regulator with XRE-family HTH domain